MLMIKNKFGWLGKNTTSCKISSGYTLVEILVAVGIFLIVGGAIYQTYIGLFKLLDSSGATIAVNDLANEQFEIIRNMPYANVGILNGIPSGTLPRAQTFVRDGYIFESTTTIRNVSDPFDTSGTPGTTADYKLVEFDINCSSCVNFNPVSFSGIVAAQGLPSSPNNGSLFVQVLDANGNPVPQAQVQIINMKVTPNINIVDQTNNSGIYPLVNTPTSTTAYQIIASKEGYSIDQTYPPGGNNNPNPTKPNATVAAQQLTELTLSIDKTSTLNVSTVLPNCTPVPNVTYNIAGSKTIGMDNSGNPILKYNSNNTTNGSGNSALSNMEWDSYNITMNDPNYDLAGSISQLPINLAPNSNQNVLLIVAPIDPKSVLFTVKDSATGLPLTNTSVELTGNNTSYDNTLITNEGYLGQSDWSGGSGQSNFSNQSSFFSTDGNIEYLATPGQLTLKNNFGQYEPSGSLTSSSFDTGSSANFYQLTWNPLSQPANVGTPNVQYQIATNNDDATWNFTGPDGTPSTYYDATDQNINSINNGNRYLRYELFLNTASTTFTPTVSNVSFTYTSSCVPAGQVLFPGLANDTYTYTISRSGYQTTTGTLTINGGSPNWQNQTVLLQSQ
jgi:hypothetical protein